MPPVSFFISAAAVSLPLAMAALMVCRSRSWRNSESDGSMMEGSITSSVRFPSQVAARAFRGNGLGGQLFLGGGKSGLHLLDLLHHFHHVHGCRIWKYGLMLFIGK